MAAPTAVSAALIGADQVAVEMETKWGVGRLQRLVSDTTRLRFKRAWELFNAAVTSGNKSDLDKQGTMMRRAWQSLDAEATAAGHAVLSPLVWEHRLADGRVLAIVRTQAEAHAVAPANRHMEVWTLQEIANVLGTYNIVSAIKGEFPGAKVERVTHHGEGFARDWVQDAEFGEQDVA